VTQTAEPVEQTGVPAAVDALVRLLRQLGRDDLVERATAAGARLRRPSTVVCVVGEFKQGKSSLVNGLLGHDVCPVDDDLATSAITLVRYGDDLAAVVRRREGEEQVAERIPVEELGGWVSEVGNPRNEKRVERVEITVPTAILRQGLVLVDTPGMGGLGAGHAAATLAFLPFADGLVLTSDASSELAAPEIELLRRATELCPTVLFVQTKIDLYPAWERIFALNRGHLDRAGVDIPMVAVSSALRRAALAQKDRELNDLSRFPELIQALGERVVEPAKANAAERSGADVRGIVALVRAGLEDEKRMLADPSVRDAAMADIQKATQRLEHLRGPGARWSVVVADRVADLSASVMHHFRGGMRAMSRGIEERIETLKSGSEWDELGRELQSGVADEVARAFVAVEEGRAAIRAEVAELLQEEHLALPKVRGGRSDAVDIAELWQGKSIEEDSRRSTRVFKTGLTGVRGAQGGVMMFGMMGQFLPTAAATLVASNPVLLGAGAVMGGVQLLEDRKRKITMRRQNARQQVRQFVDDVQFEIGNELTNLVRDVQRDMRDEFTALLGDLQRTYTETAQRAQQAAKQSQEQQQARGAQIDQIVAALTKIEQAASGASA
jgi:hypothetical protein